MFVLLFSLSSTPGWSCGVFFFFHFALCGVLFRFLSLLAPNCAPLVHLRCVCACFCLLSAFSIPFGLLCCVRSSFIFLFVSLVHSYFYLYLYCLFVLLIDPRPCALFLFLVLALISPQRFHFIVSCFVCIFVF